jgi:hypothetical protein
MTQDEIIEMADKADEEADNVLNMKGEYHPNWHQVRDEIFAKLVAEKERTFCIQFLMELHSSQMGAHNYFHYAAQALSQLEGKELPAKFSLTIEKEKPIKKYND